MLKDNRMYNQDHKTAKLIVYILIIGIVLLDLPSIGWFVHPGEILAVTVWFWGLNPVAYLVECIRKHPHQHNKL